MKTLLFLGAGILLAIPIAWFLWNSRVVTQTAPYITVRTDGPFELRDYPALTLATTAMDGERGNGSFGRLFGFITGKNTQARKIPMTTPVLINPTTGKRSMSFVMPEAIVQNGVPEPGSGGGVRLEKLEQGRYAVLRFAGGNREKDRQAAAEKLHAWLQQQGIAAESEMLFAYYDPPWTPVFLRRNEVLVKVPAETK